MSTSLPPGSGRRSGLPYPGTPPATRDDLPDRGRPGAPGAWGLRAVARIIDFVIVLLPANALAAAVGETVEGRFQAPLWVLLVFPITFVMYETVLIARGGQTLGKFLCRLKVVAWRTGDLPTPRAAFLRAMVPGVFLFGYLLFPPLLLVVPLVYLTSVADSLYRGIHDKVADTIELYAPPVARERPAT